MLVLQVRHALVVSFSKTLLKNKKSGCPHKVGMTIKKTPSPLPPSLKAMADRPRERDGVRG